MPLIPNVVNKGGGTTGGSSFTSLTDTPPTFTGHSMETVIVNRDETGLDFIHQLSGYTIRESAPTFGVMELMAVYAHTVPNMYVKVDAGLFKYYGQQGTTSFSGISYLGINTSNQTYPRKDIVYISSAGQVLYLQGTAAENPQPPSQPSNSILLAEIYVKAGTTSIRNNDIKDKRQWYALPRKSSALYLSDIRVDIPWTATQGIATDGTYLYTTTDRNTSFVLQNFITKFDFNGNVVMTKTDSYTNTDPYGNFMSQFSALYYDGFLWVVVSNWNSRGTDPTWNRVIKFNTSNLTVVAEYDIGDGGAEGLFYKDDFFYICYHDVTQIRKFNTAFVLQQTYELNAGNLTFVDGMYQGIIFYDDIVILTTHGPNTRNNAIGQYGGTSGVWTSFLDIYFFDGNTFTFLDRLNSPTFGSGQGIAKLGNHIYWIDRVDNRIVKSYNPSWIRTTI